MYHRLTAGPDPEIFQGRSAQDMIFCKRFETIFPFSLIILGAIIAIICCFEINFGILNVSLAWLEI